MTRATPPTTLPAIIAILFLDPAGVSLTSVLVEGSFGEGVGPGVGEGGVFVIK